MNDFIPETAAYVASKLFDLSNANEVTKISKSISKEDPDKIAEFIIILGGIFFTYSKAVEKKFGKKFNKEFLTYISDMQIRKIIEEEGGLK
jgi:hypothetical protein